MSTPIQDQSRAKDQEKIEQNKKSGHRQGIAQKPIDEAIPTLEMAQTEKIIKGANNSIVVLGRDRPNNLYSGFGGRGGTQCGRIDLIAGAASSYRHKDGSYGPPNDETVVNPNFAMDAARIYVSQKANIDRYMGLAEVPLQTPPGRSAVGIKADAIRLHSRNDIKIVTGRMRTEATGKSGERLSNGGKNEVVGTISLIAGNYTGEEDRSFFDIMRPFGRTQDTRRTLQPIPKGDNLSECLEDVVLALQKLSAIVGDNTAMIQRMDLALSRHTHPIGVSPIAPYAPQALPPLPIPGVNLPGYPTTAFIQAKSGDLIKDRQQFNKNLEAIKFNYLNEHFGSDYINSKFVFTT
jgi:hypothetical protein